MIDPTQEPLLSLADAAKAKFLPKRRRGKKPHISTLFRWSTVGCKGVVLETVQVGGTRCTSEEALIRFIEALTYSDSPISHRSPARRRRAAAAAEQELQREGV